MLKRSVKIGRNVSRLFGLIEVLGVLGTARLLLQSYRPSGRSAFSFAVPGLPHPVNIRPRTTDLHVFMQVFAMNEYDLHEFEQSKQIFARYDRLVENNMRPLIIDCGANIGMATLWWQRLFPQAEIVAIEPFKANYEVLTKNTSAYPSVECLNAAVWDHKTSLHLENPDDGAWAFKFSESHPEAVRKVNGGGVETVTIPEILARDGREERLLIVKIDIEGGEKQLFSSNTAWVAATPLIIIETHDSLQPSKMTSLPFIKELSKHNFEMCFLGENTFVFMAPDDAPKPSALALAEP